MNKAFRSWKLLLDDEDDSGIFMSDQSSGQMDNECSSNVENEDIHEVDPEHNIISDKDLDSTSNALISNLTTVLNLVSIDHNSDDESEGSSKDLKLANISEVSNAKPELSISISTKLLKTKEVSCEVCSFKATSVDDLNEHIKKTHNVKKDKVNIR